jgi:spermidine synthase
MALFSLAANGKAAPRAEPVARWTRVLCVLFFFSGFPALIYQLTWQRALFRIFGVNVESVTIVVTAFMLGLGLGSLLGGWLSKRRSVPLLPLLAAIELMTGAFGLASLAIFDRVGEMTIGLPLPMTAGVTLALLIVPTLLMGATLPVLVSHLVRRSGHVGSSVGLLYYVNTLGAGAACLVATVLLFPFAGMQGAIYAAAAINGSVAAGALVAHWQEMGRHAESTVQYAAAAPEAHAPLLRFGSVLGLAAAGGFVSLSYEIFFFRIISFASGSSATAFALTLGAFLVGIASGSRQAGQNCAASTRGGALRHAVAALMTASVLGLLLLPLLAHLWRLHLGIIVVVVVAVYLIARCWGSLLPYLAELGVAADDRSGMRLGLLYLANILGSAAGSILTGFVLMDQLSLVAIGSSLVVGGLLCVLLLIAALDEPRSEKTRRAAFAAVLAVLAVVAMPRLSGDVLEVLQWKGAADARPFAQIVENRSGIIAVTDDGTVYGHGMYDGRFNTDPWHDTNGIVRPYALSLFHPAPRNVLMIGLSSGSWAQVIANNPDVVSLTVIEINPGYLTLIAQEPEVASLLNNPKVSIITDDGRRWLRANPGRRFDAIVSNTTWHFRANTTNLLSVEFLDLIKEHLNRGGILFYNTTDSDRVQRTGCLAFQYGARFTNHMVVSQDPLAFDFDRWRHTLESYRIDGRSIYDAVRDRAALDRMVSLKAWPAAGREDYRAVESCAGILARTAGKAAVTDDNMGTEWRHSLGLD